MCGNIITSQINTRNSITRRRARTYLIQNCHYNNCLLYSSSAWLEIVEKRGGWERPCTDIRMFTFVRKMDFSTYSNDSYQWRSPFNAICRCTCASFGPPPLTSTCPKYVETEYSSLSARACVWNHAMGDSSSTLQRWAWANIITWMGTCTAPCAFPVNFIALLRLAPKTEPINP